MEVLLSWAPKNWADVAAVVQVVQFGIVILALIYAYRQVKYARGQMDEAGRARRLQATRELLNEIGMEEVRRLRGWVLDEMDSSNLTREDHWKARRVAVAYDRVAYMVKQGLIPEDALFQFQQDEIAQLWEKLKPVIEDVQKKRNRLNYCRNFEWLAEEWLPQAKAKGG